MIRVVNAISALLIAALILLSGCATTYDISEKYSPYIGKQFRTRRDGYIWKSQRHQYEFYPYKLDSSESLGGHLDYIPAHTLVTVKAAKRSYKGGDWDYLIFEVRAPDSGQIYIVEELLGFSTYLPKDIEKFLQPVEKTTEVNAQFNSGDYFNSPNGRFSIRKNIFPTSPEQWTVTEPKDIGAFSFYFSNGGIVRIDYWNTQQQPLAKWMQTSEARTEPDRIFDGIIRFTQAQTAGLKEFRLLTRYTNAELGETMSGGIFRMRIASGQHAGSYYRGFLVFLNGSESYVIHYQTSDAFSDDNTASDFIRGRLLALKNGMVFHDQQ